MLEVGKTYRTRGGLTVLISRDNGDRTMPFYGEIRDAAGDLDRIAYFNHVGGYHPGNTPESDYDIMSEVRP